MLRGATRLLPILVVAGLAVVAVRAYSGRNEPAERAVRKRPQERKLMPRKSTSRLPFFLLMGLTLYAAIMGAG